jgi:hypothetical protein
MVNADRKVQGINAAPAATIPNQHTTTFKNRFQQLSSSAEHPLMLLMQLSHLPHIIPFNRGPYP